MALDQQLIKLIEGALSRGNRVELIPVKDGVKALEIHRKELSQRPVSIGQKITEDHAVAE